MYEDLIDKLKTKTAIVGIVGLGYVGLPLAIRFLESGLDVVGFDVDSDKVDALENGKSYIGHISEQRIKAAVQAKGRFTTDFSEAGGCDALIICVPTPLSRYREPDLTFVTKTVDSLLPHLRVGQVISLESTTYPGTTQEVVRPRLESTGLGVGEDIFLVYSPEREDPGNREYSTSTIPKLVGGVTARCRNCGIELYKSIIDTVVPVSSPEVGEMAKLLENIHRAVNIGLVNEMKIVADRMGIDIFEVIDAAKTKPFGFTAFYPGPGLGGHCIPIDPFYLTWKAREFGIHTRFIELAGEINQSMPSYVIGKLVEALSEKGKPLKGAAILVLGIAYKKNVDDMRESPAVEMMEILRGKGAVVAYSDPNVPQFPQMREHQFDLDSVELNEASVSNCDAVLLATDHDCFDYALIERAAQLIVDTRGKFRSPSEKIVRA